MHRPKIINAFLEFSFYVICYLSRVWYFPKPQPEEVEDIKDWTPETFNFYRRAVVDVFDPDHEDFFGLRVFKNLNEILAIGDQVDKYERLHRLRWKRADDEVGYNASKNVGFWRVLIRHIMVDF